MIKLSVFKDVENNTEFRQSSGSWKAPPRENVSGKACGPQQSRGSPWKVCSSLESSDRHIGREKVGLQFLAPRGTGGEGGTVFQHSLAGFRSNSSRYAVG